MSNTLSSHRPPLSTLMSQGMDVLPIFAEMEHNGMPASRSYFESLSSLMTIEMSRIQRGISADYCAGTLINPGSSKQVAALMSSRGLIGAEFTASGDVSTAKRSIEHLRHSDPAIAAIFDWREHQHVRDAFCSPILSRMPPSESGRDIYPIRCRIKTTRTATRRLATTDPNLLALPSRTELGLRVRNGFTADDGELFGGCDLSQIEARVMAHESGDSLLCEFFRLGKDIHAETAARTFGIPLDESLPLDERYKVIPKDKRRSAKTTNFGIIYGIQGAGLQAQLRMQGILGWSVSDCDKLIADVLAVYSGMADYIKRVAREVSKTGVVYDCWGMPRYVPGIWSHDPRVSAEAARIAVSHRIQGGAQGMIQRSMAYLASIIRDMQDSGLNVKWRLQIHDEIILTFDEDIEEMVKRVVLDAMTNHCGIELSVPVEADWHSAKSWGDLK